MPSSPGIAHNYHLADRVSALQTLLNSGHTLRLFTNSGLTPGPGNVLSDFTEANFVGYAPIALTGQFGPPVKVVDGEYQTSSGNNTFNFSSGSPQTVYGWYLTDSSGVRFSYKFSNPVTFDVGVALSVQVLAQDWSYSIVP